MALTLPPETLHALNEYLEKVRRGRPLTNAVIFELANAGEIWKSREHAGRLSKMMHTKGLTLNSLQAALYEEPLNSMTLVILVGLEKALKPSKMQLDTKRIVDKIHKDQASHAANALHDKPGGSRDKRKEIQKIWASGKYITRTLCAEQEYTVAISTH